LEEFHKSRPWSSIRALWRILALMVTNSWWRDSTILLKMEGNLQSYTCQAFLEDSQMNSCSKFSNHSRN
jgi:hypothetical protein